MEPTALSFNSLLNRLRLLGATVVTSPPAPEGWVWLFGMKKAPVPFSKGPMYPIKARDGAEIIPGRMVSKILKRLDLDFSQQLQFWNIEEHRQYRSAASTL
jgi:hypothetical protein